VDTFTSAACADADTFAGVVYGFDLRSIGWFLSIFVRF
jgi:hypothetical protein